MRPPKGLRRPNEFCGPNTENPAVVPCPKQYGGGAYLTGKERFPMKLFCQRKRGGFKLSLILGKLRFALDYPSS